MFTHYVAIAAVSLLSLVWPVYRVSTTCQCLRICTLYFCALDHLTATACCNLQSGLVSVCMQVLCCIQSMFVRVDDKTNTKNKARRDAKITFSAVGNISDTWSFPRTPVETQTFRQHTAIPATLCLLLHHATEIKHRE